LKRGGEGAEERAPSGRRERECCDSSVERWCRGERIEGEKRREKEGDWSNQRRRCKSERVREELVSVRRRKK
jgi:hypothetical protein